MAEPDAAVTAFKTLARQFLGEAAAGAFGKCANSRCQKRSIGWICSECDQFCCNGHGFLTMELKPRVVCATCIAADEDP
jgi:hypothetical protein